MKGLFFLNKKIFFKKCSGDLNYEGLLKFRHTAIKTIQKIFKKYLT